MLATRCARAGGAIPFWHEIGTNLCDFQCAEPVF
jgi:hypothetical protein